MDIESPADRVVGGRKLPVRNIPPAEERPGRAQKRIGVGGYLKRRNRLGHSTEGCQQQAVSELDRAVARIERQRLLKIRLRSSPIPAETTQKPARRVAIIELAGLQIAAMAGQYMVAILRLFAND